MKPSTNLNDQNRWTTILALITFGQAILVTDRISVSALILVLGLVAVMGLLAVNRR